MIDFPYITGASIPFSTLAPQRSGMTPFEDRDQDTAGDTRVISRFNTIFVGQNARRMRRRSGFQLVPQKFVENCCFPPEVYKRSSGSISQIQLVWGLFADGRLRLYEGIVPLESRTPLE